MDILESMGVSTRNREQFILIRGGQVVGVATLMKTAGVKNHQNELSYFAIPEGSEQTPTVQDTPEDLASQTQPRMCSLGSSVLKKDLELSETVDEAGEDVEDGGQSSTDQDLSRDADLSLLDRLHMEEAGESILSESSMFTASLGDGNHRRETLNPPVFDESIITHQRAVDAVGNFSRQVNKTKLPPQVKQKAVDQSSSVEYDRSTARMFRTNRQRYKKRHHTDTGEVTKRTRNISLNDQEGKGLHTPRASRRSVREPPSHTSTPRPVSDGYSIKCEFCGKRLHKKSMKQHVKKFHLDKLLECRKCGYKFLREAAREIHESACVIFYEVHI